MAGDGPALRSAAADVDGSPAFRISRLGRHSMVYGIGIVLTKAVSFIMLPVYTRFLTPADYGVLQLITLILEVMSIFAGSRIAYGIIYYYQKAEDDDARRSVLSTAVLLLSVTYGAATALTFAAAPYIAAAILGDVAGGPMFVRIAAIGLAAESLLIVPLALLQIRERSRTFVTVNLVKLCLQVIFNVWFLAVLEMGVAGVLAGNLLANGLVGIFLATRLFVDVGLHPRLTVARSFLRFGLPLVAMQVATAVFTFGDRYFLNRAEDPAAVGLYGLAYQFGFMVVALGYAPFQRIWEPQRFAIAKRDDRHRIYSRVFLYLNLLLLSAALGLSIFAGDVLRLIADPAFHPAAVYVPVIVLAYVMQCWGSFLNIGIYMRERTEWFAAANWAAAIVGVVGYIFLIPPLLAWGAALATLLAMMVRLALAFTISQTLWRVDYDWTPVLRLGGLALTVGAVAALLPLETALRSIGVHGALYAAYLVAAWLLAVPREEKAAIRQGLTARLRG